MNHLQCSTYEVIYYVKAIKPLLCDAFCNIAMTESNNGNNISNNIVLILILIILSKQ